jgi:DeoR/GlpR family transcriptional regulator of sugar metabolism
MGAEPTTRRRTTRARHDALLALLREGVEGVEALAARLGVSPSTVRRDLADLQHEGRIARTYGGAMVRETFQERSFNESEQINKAAKAAIARTAVELVPEGATVFLDAGTTCLALARLLGDRGPLTVVTRGLEAGLLLARTPGVEAVMLGGAIRPLSHGVVGPLAQAALDRLSFDVAFLGADAISPDRGLGEPTIEETYVKEQAARRAAAVHVLADAGKVADTGVTAWAALPGPWSLVTDAAVPAATVAAFEERDVRVLVAEGAGS